MDTLAICDTEPIAIEGIRSLLESAEGVRVVATETSLLEGIEAVRALDPSILMVDKAFGIHAVMDWLRTLRQAPTRTAVVVWGSSISEAEALRMLQIGAAGVLRKTATLDVVLRCLRTVATGGNWMEHDLAAECERPVRAARSPLTARELV